MFTCSTLHSLLLIRVCYLLYRPYQDRYLSSSNHGARDVRAIQMTGFCVSRSDFFSRYISRFQFCFAIKYSDERMKEEESNDGGLLPSAAVALITGCFSCGCLGTKFSCPCLQRSNHRCFKKHNSQRRTNPS